MALNPRLLPHDPVGHERRLKFLVHFHREMVRLNGLASGDNRAYKPSELIAFAEIDEQEIAESHPVVYENEMKKRIAHLRKMTTWDQWRKYASNELEPANDAPELTYAQSTMILPLLVADQSQLTECGYVQTPPNKSAIHMAEASVDDNLNFERCDRCHANFQAWPTRDVEGNLTSGGKCKYHPSKPTIPQKTKGDTASGLVAQPYFPCCNGQVGTIGCTTHEHHVFKTESPPRLAAVLPFAITPDNKSPAKDISGEAIKAVAFDCEMGYTSRGMELLRLTAITWPQGERLLDVLVRPIGIIIDFNTIYSGIHSKTYANAISYDKWLASPPPPADTTLPIVESPAHARNLLCSFLTPQTPLIGHGIDNDLRAVRLCHPSIIDTVFLFPHARGLPYRMRLKTLAKTHLDRNIQISEAAGHDSMEDAKAAGDLVQVKIQQTWSLLKAKGWRLVDDGIAPPASLEKEMEARSQEPQDMQEWITAKMTEAIRGIRGQKRKIRELGMDGTNEERMEVWRETDELHRQGTNGKGRAEDEQHFDDEPEFENMQKGIELDYGDNRPCKNEENVSTTRPEMEQRDTRPAKSQKTQEESSQDLSDAVRKLKENVAKWTKQ